MEKPIVLLVEDDPDIRETVSILLRNANYEIHAAADGNSAMEALTPDTDIVVLDVMLPDMSGFTVCKLIRDRSNVPVLFLTAKSQENDKLLGLTAGGDDYLTKPFSFPELLARINALIRRYQVYQGKEGASEPDVAQYMEDGDLRVNTVENEVLKAGIPLEMSDLEYGILRLLMKAPGRVFSAQQIYEAVWNEPYFYGNNNTIMVHIRNLRVRIEDDPRHPARITTVWGKGYRYVRAKTAPGDPAGKNGGQS